MNRAALFFDIDGTVLSEITKEIPASTVDALKRAHDAGHFLFINTGRTYCSVPVELKTLRAHVGEAERTVFAQPFQWRQ